MEGVPQWFWVVCAGALGAILGSYVNMAAYRLPRDISTVTRARSFCPQCQHTLAWYENIPILSFLFLRGRCRHCHQPIGLRYLLTELLITALFVVSAYQYFILNDGWHGTEPLVFFLVQLFLVTDMVLLSVIDLETWLIPGETTTPGIILGLILAVTCPSLHLAPTEWAASPWQDALIDSFIGVVLGAGTLWAVGFLTTFFTFFWYKYQGTGERPREGMGMGDVHLLGMMGALLGWKAALETILLGVFIGSAAGISKIFWERFQAWRLGGAYKPWQPRYEMPGDDAPAPPPRFWPLGVCGVIVLLGAGFLYEQSDRTFRGQGFDGRLISVFAMIIIGSLLLLAFPFMKYLAAINKLPQGEIEETETGEKEEVLTGNYIPFGPSLAAAALLVAFYDPLIRDAGRYITLQQPKMGDIEFRMPADKLIGKAVRPVLRLLHPDMPKADPKVRKAPR
jgi:leader peptidase (prepilin peptidase) / N-methyltransferase